MYRFASLSDECAPPAVLPDLQPSNLEDQVSLGLATDRALVPYIPYS